MPLVREECLRRFHERDHAHDGAFVVGVTSTGIYCLPSCSARKPRPENVLFFEDEEGARSAGLRACKRCRPDHFYRRYDPERERVEALAAAVRERPGAFEGVADMARQAGVGVTKLGELLRRELHASPAAFLQRARVAEAARRLLESRASVLEVALAAGFESSSAFHEAFRRRMRLSPGAYRKLATERAFTLALPADYRPEDLFGLFGRDASGRTERVDGRRAVKALLLEGRAARLELSFSAARVRCEVVGGPLVRVTRAMMAAAHASALGMLGLSLDPEPFERRATRWPGLRALVRRRPGLRIPQTADAFEGLVWVVVGQQVNLSFASTCRERLIELVGEDAGEGFLAHPSPAAVARLDHADLTRRQFSHRKAEYVIDTARAIASGALALETLGERSAGAVREALGAVRGLGPWSVNYLLMRSFAFEDCVPLGDAALVAALERFFGLSGRPDARETERLMAPFAPHRSFATFHLWKSLGD